MAYSFFLHAIVSNILAKLATICYAVLQLSRVFLLGSPVECDMKNLCSENDYWRAHEVHNMKFDRKM